MEQLGKNADEIINGSVYLHNAAAAQFIVSP
jgi:dynein heavy chain 2